MLYGSFVNSPSLMQMVNDYEFYPSRGAPISSRFLNATAPANLYPLSWLLPNGLVFMQAGWQATLLNYTTGAETALPNIPAAQVSRDGPADRSRLWAELTCSHRVQRNYPASGSATMLPLTSADNFTPRLLFCGGLAPENDE